MYINRLMEKQIWYFHRKEYYSPLIRNNILIHATPRKKLENVSLSEISDAKEHVCFHFYFVLVNSDFYNKTPWTWWLNFLHF